MERSALLLLSRRVSTAKLCVAKSGVELRNNLSADFALVLAPPGLEQEHAQPSSGRSVRVALGRMLSFAEHAPRPSR